MRIDVEVTGLTLIKGKDETSVVLATLQGVDTDFHCSMTDELPKVEA